MRANPQCRDNLWGHCAGDLVTQCSLVLQGPGCPKHSLLLAWILRLFLGLSVVCPLPDKTCKSTGVLFFSRQWGPLAFSPHHSKFYQTSPSYLTFLLPGCTAITQPLPLGCLLLLWGLSEVIMIVPSRVRNLRNEVRWVLGRRCIWARSTVTIWGPVFSSLFYRPTFKFKLLCETCACVSFYISALYNYSPIFQTDSEEEELKRNRFEDSPHRCVFLTLWHLLCASKWLRNNLE